MDETRAVLHSPEMDLPEAASRARPHWLRKLMEREFIAKPTRLEALRPLFRFYQSTGLQKWLRQIRLLNKTKLAVLEAQLRLVDKPCNSDGEAGTEHGRKFIRTKADRAARSASSSAAWRG